MGGWTELCRQQILRIDLRTASAAVILPSLTCRLLCEPSACFSASHDVKTPIVNLGGSLDQNVVVNWMSIELELHPPIRYRSEVVDVADRKIPKCLVATKVVGSPEAGRLSIRDLR